MKKFILFILMSVFAYNGVIAQSLGKMRLGCKRSEITFCLPKGFDTCKTNTDNQLTYTTSKGDEYVSFYFQNNVTYKIVMHKFVAHESNIDKVNSKIEELIMNLYEMWGDPSYVGENIYWHFPTSKATFSYTVSTSYINLNPDLYSGTSYVKTFYKCYADIKLDKKTNLFE